MKGNCGAPFERVPIYIGRDKSTFPVLAGLTNCDGHFKFRLWIKEDERSHEVQTTKGFEGYLYVMGSVKKMTGILATGPYKDFRPRSGSYTQRYSLMTLKTQFSKGAENGSATSKGSEDGSE